jgi:uncharacterized protein YecE (DUF72 family)
MMISNTPSTDLFGFPQDGPADKPRKSVGASTASSGPSGRPTASPPTVAASTVASRLAPNVRLGTSSWSFPGWAGLVYGGNYTESRLAKDGLAAYAAHPLLRTVSIDRTFYAPLAEHEFAKHAEQVPADFRFVVKAPMAITSSYVGSDTGEFSDSPYFLNVEYAIEEFIAPCSAGLGATTGPLVFQFPPQGRRVTGNPDPFINQLYRFLNQLPPGLPYAVEVRDRKLLTTRFFKCLTTTATRFCVASHAKMPTPAEQIQLMSDNMPAGDFICRWSLHAGFRYEDAKARYFPFDRLVDEDLESRAALAIAVTTAARAGYASFVTINNKAEGCAPLSVEKLAVAIADAMQPTPAARA